VEFAEHAGSTLASIIVDPDIQLVPTTTPELDAFDNANPALKPHARSNAAMKLSVARDLWDIVHRVIPVDDIFVTGQKLLACLVENESDLVWETDSPHDARTQWTLLCGEILVHCGSDPLKEFWGVRGAMKGDCRWQVSQWSSEVKSLVWRKFVERWREIAPSSWEDALLLLGVPFS